MADKIDRIAFWVAPALISLGLVVAVGVTLLAPDRPATPPQIVDAPVRAPEGWRALDRADASTWLAAARGHRRLQATQWTIMALAGALPSETENGWHERGDRVESCVTARAVALQPTQPVYDVVPDCIDAAGR